MKNKKSVVKKEKLSKKFGSESPIAISLCLGKIIKGLHLDFVVIKEGEDRGSFLVLALNNKPIAFYDMEWSDHVLPEDGKLCMHAELL